MLSSVLSLCLLTQPTPTGSWRGEYVFTIRGSGTTKSGPSTARWKINRESRGTIVLDKGIRGGAIGGTPDSNNLSRYESWIGSQRLKHQVRISDEVIQRGPLFHPKEIRRDTLRVTCPSDPSKGEWETADLGWPTLQLDLQKGAFAWEAPRIEAPSQRFFQREFIEGPAKWTSKPTAVTNARELSFQFIYELNQPREWFRIDGAFKPGQKVITLTRKFPFTVMLMAGLTAPKVEAELTLVLQRIE